MDGKFIGRAANYIQRPGDIQVDESLTQPTLQPSTTGLHVDGVYRTAAINWNEDELSNLSLIDCLTKIQRRRMRHRLHLYNFCEDFLLDLFLLQKL